MSSQDVVKVDTKEAKQYESPASAKAEKGGNKHNNLLPQGFNSKLRRIEIQKSIDNLRNQTYPEFRRAFPEPKSTSPKSTPKDSKEEAPENQERYTNKSLEYAALHNFRLSVWYQDNTSLQKVLELLKHETNSQARNGEKIATLYAQLVSKNEFENHPDIMADLNDARIANSEKISRSAFMTSFKYNNTAAYYNSSTVLRGKLTFLLMNAPLSEKGSKNLDRLLTEFPVTRLIRVTPEYKLSEFDENGNKRSNRGSLQSYPYWKGKVLDNCYIVGGKKIPYTEEENWPDNEKAENIRMVYEYCLKCVEEIKIQIEKQEQPLIATHCHSGVGRAATVVAAIIMIYEVDERIENGEDPTQIKIDIPEIVYHLSLQRIHAVSDQGYLMLFTMLRLHLERRISEGAKKENTIPGITAPGTADTSAAGSDFVSNSKMRLQNINDEFASTRVSSDRANNNEETETVGNSQKSMLTSAELPKDTLPHTTSILPQSSTALSALTK